MSQYAGPGRAACQVPKQLKKALYCPAGFPLGGQIALPGVGRTARLAVRVQVPPNFIILLGRLGLTALAAGLSLLGLPAGPGSHVGGQAGLAVAVIGLRCLDQIELAQGLGLAALPAGLLAGLAGHTRTMGTSAGARQG